MIGMFYLCFSYTYHVISFFSFFFSSRRRHTRLQGDWSSDVCSSDLSRRQPRSSSGSDLRPFWRPSSRTRLGVARARRLARRGAKEWAARGGQTAFPREIGRASCRERESRWEGEGAWE